MTTDGSNHEFVVALEAKLHDFAGLDDGEHNLLIAAIAFAMPAAELVSLKHSKFSSTTIQDISKLSVTFNFLNKQTIARWESRLGEVEFNVFLTRSAIMFSTTTICATPTMESAPWRTIRAGTTEAAGTLVSDSSGVMGHCDHHIDCCGVWNGASLGSKRKDCSKHRKRFKENKSLNLKYAVMWKCNEFVNYCMISLKQLSSIRLSIADRGTKSSQGHEKVQCPTFEIFCSSIEGGSDSI